MTGTYQTNDGCIYRVFEQKYGKPAKLTLMAICEKSSVKEGPFKAFPLIKGQIERNLNSKNWTKLT